MSENKKAAAIFDTDHIAKTYFSMSIPVVLGMVVSLVYNLTDTFFVAHTGDLNIVAAVSLCGPISTALMAFGNIFGQGGSSLISRMLGAKDSEGSRRISSFSFYAAIAVGLLIAMILVTFSEPMLKLLGADSETWAPAKEYYMVMAIGSPIVVLNFIHNNLLRCEGMATQSMIGNIAGTVLNMILDPILISVCGMGALGAAIATVIGHTVSVLYWLIVLLKKSQVLSVDPRKCRIHSNELSQVMGVGITAAASNLMQSAAVVILNQFLLPYGNDYIAAMGIVMKIVMIVQLIMVGFSFGGVPLYGYLFGAGNREKLQELINFCLRFLVGMALAFTLVIFLSAPWLIRIFLSDETLIGTAVVMLRFQVAGSAFMAVVLLTTVLFQAMGAVVPAFVMSLSRQGVIFIVVLLLLNAVFGYTGILAAQLVSDVVSAAIGVTLYVHAMKGRKDQPAAGTH